MNVNSSKNKQKISACEIPVARAETHILCPVYWLERLFARFPRKESTMFFSTMNYQQVTYTAFDKSLKKLIAET